MDWLILSAIIFALNANPCFGQNYDSNVRIINQSANGLAYPSSSYIGPGTLSKTAQEGAGYAPQQNYSGLPKVNHGAYLGTPGDNLYSGHPDLSQPPRPVPVQRSKFIYRQVETIKPKVYIPDPNIPMNYSDYKSADSAVQIDNQPKQSNNQINNINTQH